MRGSIYKILSNSNLFLLRNYKNNNQTLFFKSTGGTDHNIMG